jgi:RimJ/RimL family protein N-acetyltransferase
MMADRCVAYWLGGELTSDDVDAAFDRARAAVDADGFGMWAAERASDGALVGAVGLHYITHGQPMAGQLEVGWRLTPSAWGCGYATEGAAAALAWALERLDAEIIVSCTARRNLRSEAVMRRIGMERAPWWDFDHPALPAGHALRPHIVYEKRRTRVV